MDIQAILDASDSDLSEGDDIISSIIPNFKKRTNPHVGAQHQEFNSDNIDVERILREHDEEEEEDGDEREEGLHRRYQAPRIYELGEDHHHQLDDSLSLGASTISTHRLYSPTKHFKILQDTNPSSNTAHNLTSKDSMKAEHWDILQTILNEEEMDDDENDVQLTAATKLELGNESYNLRSLKRMHFNDSSTNLDIDAILNSIESDSDDSADLAKLDDMIHKLSLGHNVPQSSSHDNTKKSYESAESFQNTLFSHHFKESSTRLPQNPDEHSFIHESSKETRVDHYSALTAAEDYERRLLRPGQREIVSPLAVKRRMKPKIELQTKSRSHQSKKSIAHLNVPQGQYNFSGIIESKYLQRVSSQLQRNSGQSDDIGAPTALTASSKFIAIGTQRGIVLVFDLFEELRHELGNGKSEDFFVDKLGSVSSITLSSNGEHLVAGYSNGDIILWDVIKGHMVKRVTDLHVSPITVVRFVSDKNLIIVSVDATGQVNKVSFMKTMLWNTYDAKSECLLDGSAGQILCMDSLPHMSTLNVAPFRMIGSRKEFYHPSIQRLVLIALSSERSSFAIAIEPKISVLHKWPRPPPEQSRSEHTHKLPQQLNLSHIGSTEPTPEQCPVFIPCLSWGWSLVSGGENSVNPILARAWGCCVQLLRANFPPRDDQIDDDTMQWPAFGVHDEFETSSPVLSLNWLGDRSLVLLSLNYELSIIDTVMMTLLERLDFSGIGLVYAEFALSRIMTTHTSPLDSYNQQISMTFENSILSNEGRLLVLCNQEVKTLSVVAIQTQIAHLEKEGEWLEALALALDHYEYTIKSQEDRKRSPDGTKDLSYHPEFVSRLRLTEDEEWIADLLLRYICLALENLPDSDNHPSSSISKLSYIDLTRSHFQMLAGVSIEFCVTTRRLDLLFNEIYHRFFDCGFASLFFETMEPYILNDKLRYVSPLVMSHFVDYYKALNDISNVERCLLHMDVTIMDFDSILTLLRKNELFSGLFYVYTKGLDDFVAPLEAIYESIFNAADQITYKNCMDRFCRHGYKALLYLKHCFTDKTFPSGERISPEGRVETLRPELLRFLLRQSYISPNAKSELRGFRSQRFPYFYILLCLDAEALFDTISIVFDDPNVSFVNNYDIQREEDECKAISPRATNGTSEKDSICPNVNYFASAASEILSNVESSPAVSIPLPIHTRDISTSYLDFVSKYLLRGALNVPSELVKKIFTRLAQKEDENVILQLIQILPKSSYQRMEILEITERSHITRASLLLHKGGVSELFASGSDPSLCSQHFMSAIECYLSDREPKFQREVFHFIKNECIGGNSSFVRYDDSDNASMSVHDVLRNALCEKLPQLINLDPIQCAQLVSEIYVEELDSILLSLQQNDDETIQFKFLNAILSGDLAKFDIISAQLIQSNLAPDHRHKYLELMCKFHPDNVYPYLMTGSNYRVDDCLKLCQMYDIPDASAYLLEKTGNVSSALQLMLQTFESRLMTLKRIVRGLGPTSHFRGKLMQNMRDKALAQQIMTNLKNEKDAQRATQMLTVALDLCERNSSPSIQNVHGPQLWFSVLDRLTNAKSFLRLSKEMPSHSSAMYNFLNDLLRLTIQRMVPNVALSELISKISIDHSGSSLTELRDVVTILMTTYSSEVELCSRALDAMHHDIRNLAETKFHLKTGGSRIHRVNFDHNSPTNNIFKVEHNGVLNTITDEAFSIKVFSNNKSSNFLLQKKRKQKFRGRCENSFSCGKTKIHQSMMTIPDKQYAWGESSDAAFISRFVGILGDAEHVGRLH